MCRNLRIYSQLASRKLQILLPLRQELTCHTIQEWFQINKLQLKECQHSSNSHNSACKSNYLCLTMTQVQLGCKYPPCKPSLLTCSRMIRSQCLPPCSRTLSLTRQKKWANSPWTNPTHQSRKLKPRPTSTTFWVALIISLQPILKQSQSTRAPYSILLAWKLIALIRT